MSARPAEAWMARLRPWLAALPLALLAVLAVAVVLRVWILLAVKPTALNITDLLRWSLMARDGIFGEPGHTGGYAALLQALHGVRPQVDLVMAVQHLLGLATGLVLYASVKRLGAPVWAALVGAGAVLLSLDQVYLEHTLLPESLFTFLLVLALAAALRVLEAPRPLRGRLDSRMVWAAAAGATLGVATLTRTIGEPLIVVLVGWVALAVGGSLRPRLALATATALAAVVPLLGYALINDERTGNFGLTVEGSTGWALYSRTAQFADCTQFEPVDARLCDPRPPAERPGPDFYGWEGGSPARQLYGYAPLGGDQLQEQALRAIASQPEDYAGAVLEDFARYFVPSLIEARPSSGTDYGLLAIDRRDLEFERQATEVINSYWEDGPARIDDGAARPLGDLQQVLRVHPLLMLGALLLAVAGVIVGGGRVRAAAGLLLAIALALLVVPVATTVYAARYTVPAAGPLLAAASLGGWALAAAWSDRRAERRSRGELRSPAAGQA